ncbi:helix-turn-helix domain-containing protein [Baekduia sp. Peel2402]|uniref:helix-turn-helix domain-containing protein n=1 Tax=Baekduia sp. Peel2402 TaxID=3458296 RepID=UPI00403E6BEF
MAFDFAAPDAAGQEAALRFARNLRARRLTLGWTQEQAALEAHMNTSYWNRIERGRIVPGLRVAARMATVLGVTLSELVADEHERSAPYGPDLVDLVRRLRAVADTVASTDATLTDLLTDVEGVGQTDAGGRASPSKRSL